MGRILAIDYGKKRTGIAVTDPLKIIPGGLTTVDTKELMKFLKDYVVRENVEKVVIGWPTQLNGQPSENAARIANFIKAFEREMPQIPIVRYDERFTSSIAHQVMLDVGLSKKRRQNKALVDEISATLILQSYMNSLQ